jgi:hypothetical protein
LRFTVCSLHQHNIGEQNRSSIHFQPLKLGSFVPALGPTYDHNGLCRQWYECGMPQRGHWSL